MAYVLWLAYVVFPHPVGPRIAFIPGGKIPLKDKKNVEKFSLKGYEFYWGNIAK